MGSAAVFLTIVIALAVWGTILWQKFGPERPGMKKPAEVGGLDRS
jgi:hypothetical protein